MIQKYVDRYMNRKEDLRETIAAKRPEDYADLVKRVVVILTSDEYDDLDPERIAQIDHGDYQGTLLFIIAAKSYQPSDFWYVKVSYGSCSGCDTLQSIHDYGDGPPTDKQVDQYMTLALHIVQALGKLGDDCA